MTTAGNISKTTKKLAVVTSHPIQHFVPVYQRLAEEYALDIKVFYIAENGVKASVDKDFGVPFSWDVPLLDGYPHEFVQPGKIIDQFSFAEIDCETINCQLDDYGADVVWLNGYWAKVNWRVLFKRPRLPIIYTSDSNLLDHRSFATRVLKQILVRFFLSRCATFVAVSEQNERYLRHYGVPSKAIERASYPIDMRRLQQQQQQLTSSDRQKLRARYGIHDDAFVLIFSGKLVDYKCPTDLVLALVEVEKCFAPKNSAVVALFMGDGRQRQEIESLAVAEGVSDKVVIAGFVNQSEIAMHLFAADVLVLPSRKEPFGAVVSEALPFGLPIIASSQVGAVGPNSSAQEGRNALVYPWGNVAQLAQAIITLYEDTDLYQRFSKHSFDITMQHDTDIYCQAVQRCLLRGES